jgi:hypothetical protein
MSVAEVSAWHLIHFLMLSAYDVHNLRMAHRVVHNGSELTRVYLIVHVRHTMQGASGGIPNDFTYLRLPAILRTELDSKARHTDTMVRCMNSRCRRDEIPPLCPTFECNLSQQ